MLIPGRYADSFSNVWILAEHESAVSSVILAIPTVRWPRGLYAVHDLTVEIWACEVQRMLIEVDLHLPVHAYSTPDAIGVIIEVGPDDMSSLMDILRHLVYQPLSGSDAPEGIWRAAIRRVYRASSEISALSIYSPATHRYSVSAEERVAAIQESDLLTSRRIIDQHSKILVAVGRGLKRPEDLRPIAMHANRSPQDSIEAAAEDAVSVVHSRSAQLAQVAIVTPGVAMSSFRKADLHVFWTLMREREGVFYRMTRSQGALIYSIAAFNREYHDGGFGMCVVSCAPDRVMDVINSAREAATCIASGEAPVAMAGDAVELIDMTRSLAMRNPQAAAKSLLASELSTVPAQDYSAQLASVSHGSVAATAQRIVHDPGWRIRVTVPGDPG